MIDKAKGYYLGRDWVGDGLLTNSGDHWRQKRKLLTPAFNIQVLSSFREPIEKCLSVLVKRLDEFADGRPIDIQEYPHLFSMDVICGKCLEEFSDCDYIIFIAIKQLQCFNRDRDGNAGERTAKWGICLCEGQ